MMESDSLHNSAEKLFAELVEKALESGGKPDIEKACQENPELAPALRKHAARYEAAMGVFEALPDFMGETETSQVSARQWTGKRISDFEIERELGRGGMGIVFLAKQISLQRMVALKVLPPHLAGVPKYVERFTREATATASLSHKNIVPVYAAGEAG